ncbi:HEAT repeat domain-containing protein [Aquitalea sp.]|uniref:HEAT repeat domain-containing protein n=1 Tax=Aquitalea sp. TaxID=1872623 RepID=UPI00258C857F|nr:HEAT repeat domain-containing protein [Aquitalea sp.]
MSGGISAIRGFDYQATVILDLLLDHFELHGLSASVRPEGEDDLDLRWTDAGVGCSRFVQVKKPTEDVQARPNPSPWSLTDIVRELLPDAIARLTGNDHEQVWVLGDEVDAMGRGLFDAGPEGPAKTPDAYWTVIHGLARKEAQLLLPAGSAVAKAASRWFAPKSLPTDPAEAQTALVTAANAFGQLHSSAGAVFAQRYAQEVGLLHALLPGVLCRIQILDANGTEIDVAERVMQRLEQRYGLKRPVIEHTLFRNLRGFINDIAKQPARSFDLEEFERELRCVWPQMVPVKEPPPLEDDHVWRPALAADLADAWEGAAVEVVGISGSGKTRLAAEILERSRLIHPNRVALYAEVRANISLRDCLVGVAFHLRRKSVPEPFAVAVQPGLADEGILAALAKVFSEISSECLLLLDLVEGSEPPGFARDLAAFIRAQPSNGLRLIVFGQERVFREFTGLEQAQLGVRSCDTPGLSFEEFVTLVGRRHAEPDRAKLWSVYQQITAGRAAGLNVSLAQALSRVQTTDEMAALAACPAEERLATAERTRFNRVTDRARAAAEKLTCFALPFSRVAAKGVFPSDNVGQAIRELLDLGLLRRHDGETFEMHETVRVGLEELIAPQMQRDAHSALAAWYRDKGQIGAVILHLEQAGRSQEARAHAREAFLAGESWTALWPYIARHGLVSANEVASVIAGPRQVEGAYLLADIFNELKDSSKALNDLVRAQPERIFADPEWARPILEAILAAEPSCLGDLIQFMIQSTPNPKAGAQALSWLSIAARRQRGTIGPTALALLDRQPEEIQKPFLGLLLYANGAALRHALHYLWTHPQLIEAGRGDGWPTLYLKVNTVEDVADLLAAIPEVPQADMIRTRSPLFGPLGGLIWRVRKALRGPCVAVLQAQALDSDALVNAIRILVYLGEPKILNLCEALRGRADGAGTLANLVTAIVPALVDWRHYEERVLDATAEFQFRAQALISLAWSGSRLDGLLDRLQAMDSSDWPRWRAVFRIIASVTPFTEAIPVLEEALASEDDIGWTGLPSIIVRQGQAPGPNVTAALLQALAHGNPHVRLSAAITLARRRDRAALPRLIERYGQEEALEVQTMLATTILASGAGSTADLAAHIGTPAADLWWCVLAHRTRDLSAADRLVSIATDPHQLWSVRRAAIAAAGRLPYEAALVRIESSVMAERSPFTQDHHRSLLAHDAMTTILPQAAWGLRQFYRGDRAGFVSCFEPYFEGSWQRTLDPTDLPSSTDAAGWLYDVLVCGGDLDSARLDQLLNSLHAPLLQAAVLRSLRLCGRLDRLDVHLAAASHVWMALRALLERSKFPERGPALGQKLQALVMGTTWADDRVVNELLNQLATSPVLNAGSMPAAVPTSTPPSVISPLTYQAAVRLLSGGAAHPLPDGPLVLEPLIVDECETLIGLADPAKDPERGETVFAPAVAFTKEGHQVSQRRTTFQGGPSLQDRLRLAIAAANRFGLAIPWHMKQLEGPLGETYASDFLACLAAQGDDAHFYSVLAEAEETLMPALCQKAHVLSAQLEIDGRLIPVLTRFLSVGGDDFFEGLCILARCIDTPDIQPILEGLLHRWIQRFDVQADRPQNDEAFSLWRGFARLSEHPRFNTIPDWSQQMEAVLRAPMAWFHAQSIMRVLERDSQSYVLVEARLFKEANWEHYREDEFERLDRAAETLFGQFQDTSAH